MKDIFDFFDKLKENWREWKSLPYVGIALAAAYIWLILQFEALRTLWGFICLALVFVGVFAAYFFLCALHVMHEKEKAEEAAGTVCKNTKKRVALIIGLCVSVLLGVFSAYQLGFDLTDKDGKYVIWADEYHRAMTPFTSNEFYLEDAEISAKAGKLEDYPSSCVFELDFKNDGTFTISHNGELYGTAPGEMGGVGCNDNQTCTVWKIEGEENGVCRIKNVETGKYLQWHAKNDNWTCKAINEKYKNQYNMCIEKVG